MATKAKGTERDDDFGVWLAEHCGSMSKNGKKEVSAKKATAKPGPAKKGGKK